MEMLLRIASDDDDDGDDGGNGNVNVDASKKRKVAFEFEDGEEHPLDELMPLEGNKVSNARVTMIWLKI